MNPAAGQRAEIRRPLSWILVGALCISALTAIVAILGGGFDEDDARVIGTSMSFGVYSALAATGASLRLRASENLRTLGLVTVFLSAAGFIFLMPGLWWTDDNHENVWRIWGIATLGALACSHASLTTGAFRDTDSQAVRYLGITSISLSAFESGIGILAIAGAFDDVDLSDGAAQFLSVLVILLLLTTALTPIVRRIQRAAPGEPTPAPPPSPAPPRSPTTPAPTAPVPTERTPATPPPAPLAAEVIAAADRIEALNADPGNRAPEIRREVQRLRELARTYSR